MSSNNKELQCDGVSNSATPYSYANIRPTLANVHMNFVRRFLNLEDNTRLYKVKFILTLFNKR